MDPKNFRDPNLILSGGSRPNATPSFSQDAKDFGVSEMALVLDETALLNYIASTEYHRREMTANCLTVIQVLRARAHTEQPACNMCCSL